MHLPSQSPSVKKRNSLAMLIQDSSSSSSGAIQQNTIVLPRNSGGSGGGVAGGGGGGVSISTRPTSMLIPTDTDSCPLATSAPILYNQGQYVSATVIPRIVGVKTLGEEISDTPTTAGGGGSRTSLVGTRSFYIIPSRMVNTPTTTNNSNNSSLSVITTTTTTSAAAAASVVGGLELNRLLDSHQQQQQQQPFATKRRRGVSTSELPQTTTSIHSASFTCNNNSSSRQLPSSSSSFQIKQALRQTIVPTSVSPDEIPGKISSRSSFTPSLSVSHSADQNTMARDIQIKERQRKDSHNFVEQKRRTHINAQISTLENILKSRLQEESSDGRISQGTILTKSVEYINEQHLMIQMRATWNAMIPAITPLLDLTRSMEQRLSSLNVPYPKRSEELLEQMRRLANILNRPQSDETQNRQTTTHDYSSSSLDGASSSSDFHMKQSPTHDLEIPENLPMIDAELLEDLVPLDYCGLDECDGLQTIQSEEDSQLEAQIRKQFENFIPVDHEDGNPDSLDPDHGGGEAMDIDYIEDWDINDLLDI